METTKEFSPEQSLRLINETMEQSRRDIINRSGSHFILWGALLTVISLVIWYLWQTTGHPAWNFLWFAMPAIGYPLGYLLGRNSGKMPENVISKTIGAVWAAYGVFAVVISMLAIFFFPMNITLLLIILFGFAESLSGILLKNWPIIIAGALSGIGGACIAVILSSSASQLLLFTLAGFILAITGVFLKFRK